MLSRKKTEEESLSTKTLVLTNKLGMHARPAAMFVKTASRFDAEITVEKDGEQVNGKSIMGLMMLAAGYGSKLKLSARGLDATQALDEIEKLFEKKFNEE
jgi:phosphocarrier protein